MSYCLRHQDKESIAAASGIALCDHGHMGRTKRDG